MKVVEVGLGSRSYCVRIGSTLIDDPASYEGSPDGDAVVISNNTVAPLYLEPVRRALASRRKHVHAVILDDGEKHKNWSTLQRIVDALVAAKADRHTTVFALGGGVIGDMAGFAAACYMRGIACVQIPTTLLAQVDSSVGGKTGINHALGKNMIGAFHQPALVIADIDTLDTLPTREYVAGLAEVIKYGAIADAAFLAWLEDHLDELLVRDKAAVVHVVTRSCEIKAAVVTGDEREAGARATLNFGHTFAHAIETGSGYGSWLHGEAVGCGMVLAAELSARLGLIDAGLSRRIATLVARAGLPVRAPPLGLDRYVELMSIDKKSAGGRPRFVLLEAAGRAIVREAPEDLVRGVLAKHS